MLCVFCMQAREADAEFEALEAEFTESGLQDERRSRDTNDSGETTHAHFVVLRKDSDVDRIDRLERVRQWNEEEFNHDQKRNSQTLDSNILTHRNRITDKLNKFEHLKDETSVKGKEKDRNSNYLPDRREGLKYRLNKFEKEIHEQTTPNKDISGRAPKLKEVSLYITLTLSFMNIHAKLHPL